MAERIDEREKQRQLMARKRASDRDLGELPKCKNLKRRKRAEKDVFLWLRTYFAHLFPNPFTDDGREIARAILHHAKIGGDQAIAAPRGEGKTTIAMCVILYCLLTGRSVFSVIFAATRVDALQILENLKHELESNELLGEDYPEVCVPIRALDRSAARASKQTLGGEFTDVTWGKEKIVLPTVKGSRASGAVLRARGLDASIRGMNHRGRRPDLAFIDDPETRESAESDQQIDQRERLIDRDIAGLAGPGKRIARIMACTISNFKCIAAKYTDPKCKPSWNGKRFALLKKKPKHEDLWEEYLYLLKTGWESGKDPEGLEATAFYLRNRKAMDEGALVSNPHRYLKGKEHSALQACYNLIARIGWDAFSTELQNEPVKEEQPEDSGITSLIVRNQLNYRKRGSVPDEAIALTVYLDLNKHGCHWAAAAWQPGAIGTVIDYGVQHVHFEPQPDEKREAQALERALLSALHAWREDIERDPWTNDSGAPIDPRIVLVDAGNWDSVVYQFVRQVGSPFRASKGFGSGYGRSPFHAGTNSKHKKVYDGYFASRQIAQGGIWLWGLDVDRWKRFAHQRFLTPTFNEDESLRLGSLSLWGDNDREHVAFSHQVVAEVEKTEFKPGKGYKRYWHRNSRQNHWLDCIAGCCAAARMAGITLMSTTPPAAAAQASTAQRKPSRFRPMPRRSREYSKRAG